MKKEKKKKIRKREATQRTQLEEEKKERKKREKRCGGEKKWFECLTVGPIKSQYLPLCH